MHLPFLDRQRELARLRAALQREGITKVCIYGRRPPTVLGAHQVVEVFDQLG